MLSLSLSLPAAPSLSLSLISPIPVFLASHTLSPPAVVFLLFGCQGKRSASLSCLLQSDSSLQSGSGDGYELGSVWPGYCYFPDFSRPNCSEYWTKQLRSYRDENGPAFDGVWIDMNEISNFCTGECNATPPPNLLDSVRRQWLCHIIVILLRSGRGIGGRYRERVYM